ncbi:GDSL-type esterase/lipase family protein [Acidisoma cladoniae]|jgi:lysophospholipase L1-like esterase|uniref:GDSL-type esterase/lipase family protein n=1 Tax=Acidisoma cladoniae TaxID=3040935 RepID=UPI0025519C91|nr:GDSL-type esterase/lipase family protein [Acidisoma sp. PAMC 29798]
MTFRRVLLALALVVILQPASGAVAAPANLATMPIDRQDLPWWRTRFAESLARVRRGDVSLVWLGDSITENWERTTPQPWGDIAPIWQRFYGDRAAVNMGFKGDTTANVIWRLDHGEVDGIAPRALVLLIGANNFGRVHWDAAKTRAGIDAIIGILRRKLPQTQILLLGVLPSQRSPWISENTAVLDADLARAYRDRSHVTFMDVGASFLKNGRVDVSLYLDPHAADLRGQTPDGAPLALHPDARGMEMIATSIEPTLHRLMADRDHVR